MGSEIPELTAATPRWPHGERLALCVTFNLESGEAAPVNPEGNPNYLYLTTHQYGARRGIWNLLEMLTRTGIQATFFVCGTTAEKYPDTIAEISRQGHDIAGFTYQYENVWAISADEEARFIDRSITAIERAAGKRPVGWRCPDFKVSRNTLKLLAERGFVWDSNLLNSELPYILELGASRLVEVPACMWTYDKHIYYLPSPRGSARELFELWTDEFEVMYEESAFAPKLMTLSAHPFLVGRPAPMAEFEAFLKRALSRRDVWPATCAQVASWWKDLACET
jgi:peptidoglycan/xylan/chitin deacetylase (PgdA/CDA1 family)